MPNAIRDESGTTFAEQWRNARLGQAGLCNRCHRRGIPVYCTGCVALVNTYSAWHTDKPEGPGAMCEACTQEVVPLVQLDALVNGGNTA